MVFPCTARIWLYQKPVDMRRSFDGLAAIAQNVLSLPAAGRDRFVFVNRRRDQQTFRKPLCVRDSRISLASPTW